MALQIGTNLIGEAVLAPLRALPSAFEQVGVFVDEHALGIEPLAPEQVEALMHEVGFEPAVWGLAAIARTIENVARTPTAQLALARKIYADDHVVALFADALRARRGDVVLAEQQLTALARLAIMSAHPLDMSQLEHANGGALERAILASGSLVLSFLNTLTGDAPDELELTSALLQIGAFCAREHLRKHLVARHTSSATSPVRLRRWSATTTLTSPNSVQTLRRSLPSGLRRWVIRMR